MQSSADVCCPLYSGLVLAAISNKKDNIFIGFEFVNLYT